MTPREARPWILPAFAAAAFGGLWLAGRTVFWGDLTYIHFPWRTFAAQELARGRVPLWDPYLYLGMPAAAQMQGALWYPGTAWFHLFGFEPALAAYLAVHFGLAALLAYLWLRRLRFSGPAALGGAAVYAACGVLASRVPFLNHLSTLALLPGLLLFAEHPWLLGLTSALAFLSGYPLMLAGGAAAAFLLSWLALGRAPRALGWTAAVALAAGLGAVLLLPAAELAAGSRRGAGMPLEEILDFGLGPRDLAGFVAPWLSPAGLDAATQWWRSCWFGLAGTLAMLAGWPRLKPRLRWGLAGWAAAVALLSLGGSTPLSRWLWTHVVVLRWVRYPGNLTYLLLPVAALAAAAGLSGRRRAGAWAVVILAELAGYALASQPVVRRPFFTDAGPLARTLQGELGESRYLLSPRAIEWTRGRGPDARSAALDLKHRLYGLTNAPFRLAAAASFGEPLVPQPDYDVMDFLYTRSGIEDVAAYLPWVGARVLLTREKLPAGPLRYLGHALWHGYAVLGGVGPAFWLPPAAGDALPAGLPASGLPDLRQARPVAFQRDGDRAWASGETPAGWLYLSEPRLPGWGAWLDGKPAEPQPALRAFQKLPVPEGRWRLALRYRPASWLLGLAATLAVLSAAAAYWYNRVTRLPHGEASSCGGPVRQPGARF